MDLKYQFFLIFLCINSAVLGQSELLKVYIDCNCDRAYLQKELAYVNHVRDQDLSDVQIFVNTISNGGGVNYDLSFVGRNDFNNLNKEHNKNK